MTFIKLKFQLPALLLITIFFLSCSGNEDFLLKTEKVENYYPAYLGNGHFSISTCQSGIASAESYMINFYDEAKNDIPRIAALPEWNEIIYSSVRNSLNRTDIHSDQITRYSQTINMRDASVDTKYRWKDESGNVSDIAVSSFVSGSDKNIAVIKFEVTPGFSGKISLAFPIEERKRPERYDLATAETIDFGEENQWPGFWYPGFTNVHNIKAEKTESGGLIFAGLKTEGRGTGGGIAADIYCENPEKNTDITIVTENNGASVNYTFQPKEGRTYTFYKFVAVVPETESGINPAKAAKETVLKAVQKGYDKNFSEHQSRWSKLWETDIIIEGDPELQKIVRSMIFYLLGSADEKTNFGIPPMGLSTAGYFGHIFWDSDIYMMPPLLLMHPEIAKSLVQFRYQTLNEALRNASLNNFEGAMYPWESDETGRETTPYFAIKNALRENHIVGDVAFAQWQYFTATGDTTYLKNFGAEIIRKTADFWLSRVKYNSEKKRYDIEEIISVSESDKYVNNETYTNSIAKINLDLAVKASRLLDLDVNPDWIKVRDNLFIPFDKEEEYHPLHEEAAAGEGASKFWSSVVNLLAYPLQVEMSETTKRNDLEHAVKSLELNGAGAMMGINFLSIIAAELGSDSLMNHTINRTLYGYLKPPYYVLSETHDNHSVNFLTGAGSFLQQIIFGYTGLRNTDEGIVEKYDPMLPAKVKKLTLKNFTINNKTCDIIVEGNRLTKIIR